MRIKRGHKRNHRLENIAILKKRVGVALIILLIGLITVSGYLVIQPRPCAGVTCFAESLQECKSVSWLRQDVQADWLYTIKGSEGENSCKINVKLARMKEGTIDIESLEGKDMLCTIPKSESQFPETYTSRCTGPLREEMQNILIQRMHNYLLENVGEIGQKFRGI